MNLYILAKLIYKYNQGDAEIMEILKNNVIWVIPAVNTDGYKRVEETFGKTHPHPWVRKNRRPSSKKFCATTAE